MTATDAWVRGKADEPYHLVASVFGGSMRYEAACGRDVSIMAGEPYPYTQWRRGHWPNEPCCLDCITEVKRWSAVRVLI